MNKSHEGNFELFTVPQGGENKLSNNVRHGNRKRIEEDMTFTQTDVGMEISHLVSNTQVGVF